MKKIAVIILLFVSAQIFSQDHNIPAEQNRNAIKSISIIESIMSSLDTTYSATWKTNSVEKIDSICYSHKSQFDLLIEKNDRGSRIIELGNRLEYYYHRIGYLTVRYVKFENNLWKIKFNFNFTYVDTDDTLYFYQPPTDILDSLKNCTKLPIVFQYFSYDNKIRGYSYTFVFPRMDNEYKLYTNKKLEPNIKVKNNDEEFQDEVDFVNDPINSLTYGFGCSVDGSPPDGLDVFAELVHYDKIYLAEKLLYSPNPVTRLMAHDAVDFYMKNNFYFPEIKIIKQLKEIEKDETIIRSCWGCSFENISMKEANIKSAGNRTHLYDNIIFPKKN